MRNVEAIESEKGTCQSTQYAAKDGALQTSPVAPVQLNTHGPMETPTGIHLICLRLHT
jgi:hypothetical protein